MARPVFCRYAKSGKRPGFMGTSPRSHSRTRASAMVLQRSNTSPGATFFSKAARLSARLRPRKGAICSSPMGTPQASPACFQALSQRRCVSNIRPSISNSTARIFFMFCLPFLWHARHGAPGFYDTPALRGAQGFPPPDALPGTVSLKGKARHALCKRRKARRALFSVCIGPKSGAGKHFIPAAPGGRPQNGWGAPRAAQASRCGTCLWRGGSGPQICSPASG